MTESSAERSFKGWVFSYVYVKIPMLVLNLAQRKDDTATFDATKVSFVWKNLNIPWYPLHHLRVGKLYLYLAPSFRRNELTKKIGASFKCGILEILDFKRMDIQKFRNMMDILHMVWLSKRKGYLLRMFGLSWEDGSVGKVLSSHKGTQFHSPNLAYRHIGNAGASRYRDLLISLSSLLKSSRPVKDPFSKTG